MVPRFPWTTIFAWTLALALVWALPLWLTLWTLGCCLILLGWSVAVVVREELRRAEAARGETVDRSGSSAWGIE